MGLIFPKEWRLYPPTGGAWNTESIPRNAIEEFMGLIRRTATQGDLQDFFEHFKGNFNLTRGTPHIRSSSVSWAETDLNYAMEEISNNPPLFIEAFFNACESLRKSSDTLYAPSHTEINKVLTGNGLGYYIESEELKLRDQNAITIHVPDPPITIASRGHDILQQSLRRSDELLHEGRGREAVQESLWLLETISTAFKGLETRTTNIEGKYFNKIVKELREAYTGTTLDRVLEWISSMQGYLSSPSGGGVRHGLDLSNGLEISVNEARLFCNLIRSYLSYLLSEHNRLFANKFGEMPISFPELPGVTPHDVGETMSEYLGLREVEKWAQENEPE